MNTRFALLIALVLTAGGLTVLTASLLAGSALRLPAALPVLAGTALLVRWLTLRRS